jgi:hypothetical protein
MISLTSHDAVLNPCRLSITKLVYILPVYPKTEDLIKNPYTTDDTVHFRQKDEDPVPEK